MLGSADQAHNLVHDLISFSWNNALQDQPVEEEVEDPTNLLVQLGTEWS